MRRLTPTSAATTGPVGPVVARVRSRVTDRRGSALVYPLMWSAVVMSLLVGLSIQVPAEAVISPTETGTHTILRGVDQKARMLAHEAGTTDPSGYLTAAVAAMPADAREHLFASESQGVVTYRLDKLCRQLVVSRTGGPGIVGSTCQSLSTPAPTVTVANPAPGTSSRWDVRFQLAQDTTAVVLALPSGTSSTAGPNVVTTGADEAGLAGGTQAVVAVTPAPDGRPTWQVTLLGTDPDETGRQRVFRAGSWVQVSFGDVTAPAAAGTYPVLVLAGPDALDAAALDGPKLELAQAAAQSQEATATIG